MLLLSSCATKPLAPKDSSAAILIIDHGPPFGGYGWYSLKVSSDGRGRLSWKSSANRDDLPRSRSFRVDPGKFEKISESLQVLRPQSNRYIGQDDPACGRYFTDQATAFVTWNGNGTKTSLGYDYGCDPVQNAELIKLIEGAPDLVLPPDLQELPLWDLVHSRRD
jgi:hypothetical protein